MWAQQPSLASNEQAECPIRSHHHTFIHSAQDGPLLHLAAQHGWDFVDFRRLLTFGYRAEPIWRLLASLPPSLCSVMQTALDTFDRLTFLQAVHPSHEAWDEAGMEIRAAEAEMLRAMEDDIEVGFLEITYDPETQRRTHVFLNSRYAAMRGVSRAELLARFAAHAVDLPSTGPDFLAALLHGMLHRLDAESTQYLRVAAGEGAAGPGMLVCEHSRKRFDGRGRITKVRRLPRACFSWVHSDGAPHPAPFSPRRCTCAGDHSCP